MFLSFLFFSVSDTRASLVTITKDGEVIVNVLSAEESIELEIPQKDYLAVKEIASESFSEDVSVSLGREGDKVSLNVSTANGEKSLDVTNYSDNLIEIEERPAVRTLSISVLGDRFAIKQKGLIAHTSYEINVDPKNAGLTLSTPSGLRYLSVLPREAADVMFRSKLIDRISGDRIMVLEEEVGEELAYVVEGVKVINIFNILDYELPVKAKVSASTGQIAGIIEPGWLKFVAFLFV